MGLRRALRLLQSATGGKRGFATSKLKADTIRFLSFEQGLTTEVKPLDSALIFESPAAVQNFDVEEGLFAAPEALNEFISNIKNNNILVDYVLKYASVADLNTVATLFTTLERNFANLTTFRAEFAEEFKASKKEMEKQHGLPPGSIEVVFPFVFCSKKEFPEKSSFPLLFQTAVVRVLADAYATEDKKEVTRVLLQVGTYDPQLLRSLELAELLLQDPDLEDWAISTLNANDPDSLTSLKRVLDALFLLADQPTLQAQACEKLGLMLSKLVDLAHKTGPNAFLAKVAADIGVRVASAGLQAVVGSSASWTELASLATSCIGSCDFEECLGLYTHYVPYGLSEADKATFHFRLLATLPNAVVAKQEVTLEWLEQLYREEGSEILDELKREIERSATHISFRLEKTPAIRVLAFQIDLLIASDRTTENHLALISHALNMADSSAFDLVSFSKVYFELTNRGYYSDVLATNYFPVISDLLTPKMRLKSPKPQEKIGSEVSRGDSEGEPRTPERLQLDLMWAYAVNAHAYFQKSQNKEILKKFASIFGTFREHVSPVLVAGSFRDDAKIRHILSLSTKLGLSKRDWFKYEFTPGLMRWSPFEKAMLGIFGPEFLDSGILTDDSWYVFLRNDEGKSEFKPTKLLAMEREVLKGTEVEVGFQDALAKGFSSRAFLERYRLFKMAPSRPKLELQRVFKQWKTRYGYLLHQNEQTDAKKGLLSAK